MDGGLIRLSPFDPADPSQKRRRSEAHAATVLEEVRRLVETTQLSYRAIQRRTGVPRSTVSRHVLEQGWLRPWAEDEAPPPSPAAQRRARRGELAALVLRAAEERAFQVAMNPTAPRPAFTEAAKLLALAERIERPGQPRSRVPRRLRLKTAKREPVLPNRPPW